MCVEIAKLFLELFLDNCYKWQGYEVNCRQANPYCAQDVIVQPVLFVTSKKKYYLCGNYNQQFSHEGVTPNV